MWGKLKTVTQMIAIIATLIDNNKFGSIFNMQMEVLPFTINFISTIMMILCVIATIFSGWTYIKDGKDLLKTK